MSLRAPANIVIDGKPKEWGGQFLAYNKTNGVFYNIANDDKNLYLIIHSNNFDISNKILGNGINISFNAKKKSTQGSLLIKYPIGPSTQEENAERLKLIKSKLSNEDGTRSGDDIKAGRLSMNKTIVAVNKQVKILGVNSFKDTLFSIYDSKDITVRLDYTQQNLLYYDLSVPLKYLEISSS